MRRAREDAGLTLGEAAALANNYVLTDGSTVSRLEKRDMVPTGARSASARQRAYVLCLAYEIDPADLDLGPDDLITAVEIPARTIAHLREASTICNAA